MNPRNPVAVCSSLPFSLRHTILRTRQWQHTLGEARSSKYSSTVCRAQAQTPTPRHDACSARSAAQTRGMVMAPTRRKISTTTTTTETTPSTLHSSAATTGSASGSGSRIIRPLVPPPTEGSGPLLSRRPDRELPNIPRRSTWSTTLPIFAILVGVSSLVIFNYQKSSSSTVSAILYALRTNQHARALLGDEIYFASSVPWIRGELAPLQGTIDITFWVKGTKTAAQVKFVSVRPSGHGFFETLEWSLKTKDGHVVHLLDQEGTNDPMQGTKI